jgi:hypothetical protein
VTLDIDRGDGRGRPRRQVRFDQRNRTAWLLATALVAGTVPQIIAGLSSNSPLEPAVRTIADCTSDVMLVGHLLSMGM